jgi:hypothetical protein
LTLQLACATKIAVALSPIDDQLKLHFPSHTHGKSWEKTTSFMLPNKSTFLAYVTVFTPFVSLFGADTAIIDTVQSIVSGF